MNDEYKINDETLLKILYNSPMILPANPSEKGMGAAQIKAYFYKFIGEIIKAINSEFSKIGRDVTKTESKIGESIYLHNNEQDAHTNIISELKGIIQALEEKKLDAKNVNHNIIKNISISKDADNAYVKVEYENLKAATESYELKEIGLANDTDSGLMSPSDVIEIRELKDRVASLEGQTLRLLYTASETPTSEQINAFVEEQGYAAPFSGIAVVVDKTFHIWHYYENDSIGWQDDGVDTVSEFTNESPGTIKGSELDGHVYAETDGTGSVVGWGEVKGDITNIKNDMSNLAGDGLETVDGKLQLNINRSNGVFDLSEGILSIDLNVLAQLLADNRYGIYATDGKLGINVGRGLTYDIFGLPSVEVGNGIKLDDGVAIDEDVVALKKELENKLDKNTEVTSGVRLYAKAANGTQSLMSVSSTAGINQIIRYQSPDDLSNTDGGGTINVTTPQKPKQAVNKEYVDDSIDAAKRTVVRDEVSSSVNLEAIAKTDYMYNELADITITFTDIPTDLSDSEINIMFQSGETPTNISIGGNIIYQPFIPKTYSIVNINAKFYTSDRWVITFNEVSI